MIIVTGTKRSGTSMWMQILEGAGLPLFGTALPEQWKALEAANPGGFFESMLRSGIYFATNPHPRTGEYLFPEQVTQHAVKIFIPGLIRTERAYIGRVVATLRQWREYEASVKRLYALEHQAAEAAGRQHRRIEMNPALEWWWQNYSLVRDVATRRYAVHYQTYDGLLEDPEKVVTETVRWLGCGDPVSAARRVQPAHRNFVRPESSSMDPQSAEVFDELYDAIHRRVGLSRAFLTKMDELNQRLWPRITEEFRSMRRQRARRADRSRAGGADTAAVALENALLDLDDDGADP